MSVSSLGELRYRHTRSICTLVVSRWQYIVIQLNKPYIHCRT